MTHGVPCEEALRGAAGQRTAQPIVATKPCEFNRPESPIRLPDENNRITGNARVAMHIKMNRA
ncbi:hypothetical protein [Burkholderia cepacia]|uniref:hypothetical protein n=1 Tax=Burkholderia cepacia TaxID=292 RepID=UPI001FC826B6|nr:hypothetical protein [Burkholderia cepacia]